MTQTPRDSLAATFENELPAILKALQDLWNGPARGTQGNLQGIRGIAHKLVGTAAAYGYLSLSEAAARLEDSVNSILENFGHNDSHRQQNLYEHLNALAALIARPCMDQTPTPATSPPTKLNARLRRIVIVDDDTAFSDLMAAEIAHFGFVVDQVASLQAFPDYLASNTPDLILMDILFPEGGTGPQFVEQLRQTLNTAIPVIFISARDNLDSRLAAIRAGGHAFFRKPFKAVELLETVDHILSIEQRAPYRVLIVDDAPSLARLYAATLSEAGMITEILSEPQVLLPTLDRFRPDLILMDIYMPEINGVELAQVIQQHRTYFGIPIIFLSAERDPIKQLRALEQGGDNFLSKPVEPDTLIKAVTIRAKHYQSLRGFMLKDSLTGLLNHSRLLEQLAHELERAARSHSPLSVALIDIDHFKSVNDRWGHVVGDHVIVSLARLLRERLRAVDIIGRYGGEEFLLVLPDTPIDKAGSVLEDLRTRFADMHQHAGEATFQVTFSAGLAEFNTRQRVDRSIVERADEALYSAKAAGRNRVCSASAE